MARQSISGFVDDPGVGPSSSLSQSEFNIFPLSSSHNIPSEPSPVTEQLSIDPARIHRRRWNIVSVLREVVRQNRRDKPLKEAPSVRESILAIFKTSWLNILFIFIPLSWIFHFLKLNNTLTFVFSFLAIAPLAKLLGFATEELSLRSGKTVAILLKITLFFA